MASVGGQLAEMLEHRGSSGRVGGAEAREGGEPSGDGRRLVSRVSLCKFDELGSSLNRVEGGQSNLR